MEDELLALIKEMDMLRFICRNILSKFGIPKVFISNNRAQFVRKKVKDLLDQLKIEFYNSTPSYP